MKVLTVTPAFVNDERMDIYYHYGDLQLVMNNAEVGNNGPYGIIWLIDSDACRGGYEGYLSDRLAVLGMPKEEIDHIMQDIQAAITDESLRYKVYN